MSKLLINESPLLVLPKLATLIGLNESIVLQQIHYWISNPLNKNIFHEKVWVYNSYEKWKEQFPFWSVPTIKRIVQSLEEKGLLISSNFNSRIVDRTKWYTIDYEAITNLELGRTDQNDPTMGSKRSDHGINLIRSITETTTETTTNKNNNNKEDQVTVVVFDVVKELKENGISEQDAVRFSKMHNPEKIQQAILLSASKNKPSAYLFIILNKPDLMLPQDEKTPTIEQKEAISPHENFIRAVAWWKSLTLARREEIVNNAWNSDDLLLFKIETQKMELSNVLSDEFSNSSWFIMMISWMNPFARFDKTGEMKSA